MLHHGTLTRMLFHNTLPITTKDLLAISYTVGDAVEIKN